jgi:hypothetical protein
MARGRKRKTGFDRLQAKVWYAAVKAVENLSDYRLGEKFGDLADLKFPKLEINPIDGKTSISSHSRRIFEFIRKNGAIPSEGKHRARNYSLVSLVGLEEGYGGTKKIFDSPFWTILKLDCDASQIRTQIIKCIGNLNLHNQSPESLINLPEISSSAENMHDLSMDEYIQMLDSEEILYDELMSFAFPISDVLTPNLDYIALFSGLAIESYYAGNIRFMKIQLHIVTSLVNAFVDQDWINNELKLEFRESTLDRLNTFLNIPKLNSESYLCLMSSETSHANPQSPIMDFLKLHEKMLWG